MLFFDSDLLMEFSSRGDPAILGKHPLFSVVGVEVGYLVVNDLTLNIKPCIFSLKNEEHDLIEEKLDMHKLVLCLKEPASSFVGLDKAFHSNILRVLNELKSHGAKLLAGAVHPWIDVMNFKGMQLHLPFRTEEDVRHLHSSLRILIPIIPAIAAASPFSKGDRTGFLDYRMHLGSSTVPQIPDVKPTPEVFGSTSYEIKAADSQECPKADLAIAESIFITARGLAAGKWNTRKFYETFSTNDLFAILVACIKSGEDAMIDNLSYLRCFGLKKPVLAKELWEKIFEELLNKKMHFYETFSEILKHGTLAKRLLKAYKKVGSLKPIYEELSKALETNQLWY